MSEPTPRPWKVDDQREHDYPAIHLRSASGEGPYRGHVASWLTVENAALIVRAVNAHEAMLAACEAALHTLCEDGDPFVGSECELGQMLSRAIALAKPTP